MDHPSAFFAINYSAQTWPSNLIETPSNALTCIVSSLTMMICYAMLFQLFDMWRKEQKLAEDNRFLDAYARGLRHEMETVRMAEERTAYWRHDMRHMFRCLPPLPGRAKARNAWSCCGTWTSGSWRPVRYTTATM